MICVRVMFPKLTWCNVNMIYVLIKSLSSKIGKWWWKRKNISLSWNKGNYNSPTIIKYKSMIIDVPTDQMFLHNETNNNNNNESMRTMLESLTNWQLKICYQKIEYLIHYILLYVIIYITTSRTRMKYQNMLLVCYSKWVIWLITRQIKVLFISITWTDKTI